MKIIITVLSIALGISYASAALSCTNLVSNVSRYQETSSVLALQNFLFEKGYLKAKPNGYFGVGTFAAVKAYQKTLGFEQVGIAGPATRAAIKRETCGTTNTTTPKTTPVTQASTSPVTKPVPVPTPTPAPVSTSVSEVVAPSYSSFPDTVSGKRNAKRKADAETILKALYRYYVDSRGTHAILSFDTPLELCTVNPKSLVGTTATSGDTFTVVTPVSPCLNLIDVSYLMPTYLKELPHDPTVATSSALSGYTITRSQFNDITIAPKVTDDSAIIKMTCNFSGYCKDIKYTSAEVYDKPEITTINRNIFLRDGIPKTPLIIKGKNFTKKNTLVLSSLYNSKEYTLGEFTSTKESTTTMSISVADPIFSYLYPCGSSCSQKLPLGDYMLNVSNEGGNSNTTRVALRGFTTMTISTQVNGSIIPTTKNVKVATITLSSSIPVTIKGLTLTSTSTSKNLPSKISNFIIKDQGDSTKVYTGGAGSFSFGAVKLFENESKVYDVYIDTAEVMNVDAGFITYGGKFLLNDSFTSFDMELPIKEFSFTVSH